MTKTVFDGEKMNNQNNDHPWIGVDAIIIGDDNKILLLKRSPNSKVFPGMWSLPSGKMEWGETVREAVIREVKEETGLDVEVTRYTGKYFDAPDRHPTKTIVCLPHYCEIIGGDLKTAPDEEAKWFSKDEIIDMELAFDHKEMLLEEGLI